MKPSYSCGKDVHVLYEGTKNLWRLRITIEILIARHKSLNTLEVVGFIPHSLNQIPRIYLSYPAVVAKLDRPEIDEKIQARKDFLLRHRKSFDSKSLSDKVIDDLVVAYIVARIDVRTGECEYRIFILERKKDSLAIEEADYIIEQPDNIQPVELNPSLSAP